MQVIKNIFNNCLTIHVEGKVDAATAPDFEHSIITDLTKVNKVVIDAKKLLYISSAGLRVILKIKKAIPDTSIIETTPEVYEIFDMTGFAELMSVSKRMRELSVDGCTVIGKGYYGTVYRISKDTIVKVYSEKMTLDRIENERDLARKAFILGIPTAIPYDIVKVGNNYGSVFELLDAQTLQERIIQHPENIEEYCKQSVDVLKVIHSAQLEKGTLVDKKAEVLEWAHNIYKLLPAEIGDKVIKLVENIKDDNHVLHGDYHIKNVMMIGNDPFIIDMDTLSQGSPIFELGFMYSSYVGYQEIDHNNAMDFFGIEHSILVNFFHRSIELYLNGKSKEEVELVIKKCRILCYIQLIDRFNTYQDHLELLEKFKAEITELVVQIDDLNL